MIPSYSWSCDVGRADASSARLGSPMATKAASAAMVLEPGLAEFLSDLAVVLIQVTASCNAAKHTTLEVPWPDTDYFMKNS